MKKYIFLIFVSVLAIFSGVFWHQHNEYDFTTLDGSKLQYADHKGEWVVVNYFAEWCAPCLREIPELNEFQQLIKNKPISLYGVSFDKLQTHELSLLKNKYEINYALIDDIKHPMPFELPQYLPATYLIKPDGSVAGQLLGEQKASTLLSAIEKEQARNE